MRIEHLTVFSGLQHEVSELINAALDFVHKPGTSANAIVLIDTLDKTATSRDIKTYYVGYGDTHKDLARILNPVK